MIGVNLISIVNAYKTLSSELFIKYLDYYSIIIKDDELKDLSILKEELTSLDVRLKINFYDNFFIGYVIPQIGKEFDLLRIGELDVVNIELKRSASEGKIYQQLLRNKYYLSFLQKKLFCCTFITESKKFYYLNKSDNLVEADLKLLYNRLKSQVAITIEDINSLFNPSDYLVSPFNSTTQFISNRFFLTSHQEAIKDDVIKNFSESKVSLVSIKGKAGTGKTLLTYDIAKYFIAQDIPILIIHCGIMNNGHWDLRNNYGWNIIPAKDISSVDITKFKVIIFDECQRVYPWQLRAVIDSATSNNGTLIFSYDAQQYLKNNELRNNIEKVLEEEFRTKTFELKTKIRTNKEIATFIKCLFDRSALREKQKFTNVSINYFNNYEESLAYLALQIDNDWKAINYTPSRDSLPYDNYKIFGEEDNSHTVIGQEFDKVIAVIDQYFSYYDDKLYYSVGSYYNPKQMLFQIVTRTRKKLNIVIINNPEILENCLSIVRH